MPPEDDAPPDESPDQGDLTSGDVSGSIHDIIARAIADAEAPSDSEDGPAEAGELSEDDAADSDETVEDPDEEPQADEQSEQEPPVAPEPQPEPPPDDTRDAEIQRLKDLVTSSQETVTKLTEVLTKQGLSVAQARPQQPRVSEAALQLALFGRSDEEDAWKALPAQERAEATRLAREHFARETRNALDPKARYQEIQQVVLEDVARLLAPVLQDYERRTAEDAFREVVGDLKDPGDKKRLAEIYRALPGSKATIAEQQASLKLAAQSLSVEKQKSQLERDQQKVDARKRQQQVVSQSKNKGTSAGRRSIGANNRERPKLRPGQNLADYAAQLENFELGG